MDTIHRQIITYPVFITGVPRSGTTLLVQLLNSSKQIFIGKETHLFQFFFNKKLNGKIDKEKIGAYLDRKKNRYLRYYDWSDSELETIRQRAKNFNLIKDFADFLIPYLINVRSIQRWGEKTPGHDSFIKEISELYPHAKFINIIRDPRAVYQSHQKVFWGLKSPLKFKKRYRNNIKIVKENSNNCKFLSIKYEDLVLFTDSTLKKICDFIDINFSEKMLTSFFLNNTPSYDKDLEPWKNNVKNQIDTENINRWDNQENFQINSFIYFLLRKEIEDNNYPKKNNNSYIENVLLFVKCLLFDYLLLIKKLYWHLLKRNK